MPSGPGAADANGIWQYGEADNPDGTASGMLNKLASTVSTAVGSMLTRLTNLEKKGLLGTNRGAVVAASPGTLAAATLTDIASVTATSHGLICTAEVSVVLANANSGADRTVSARVECDGTSIGTIDFNVRLVSGVNSMLTATYVFDSTPAAGSHTWKFRITTPAGSTVTYYNAVMSVREG